jgi:hypothetical protein
MGCPILESFFDSREGYLDLHPVFLKECRDTHPSLEKKRRMEHPKGWEDEDCEN